MGYVTAPYNSLGMRRECFVRVENFATAVYIITRIAHTFTSLTSHAKQMISYQPDLNKMNIVYLRVR